MFVARLTFASRPLTLLASRVAAEVPPRARGRPSGWGRLLGMLALLAALCFILALFKVAVPFSLVTLGLALLAIHLAWPIAIWGRRSR